MRRRRPYADEIVRVGDAAAGEHAREGKLGRADRDRRAAARVPQPRRRAGRAEPRLGRRVRRPRAARASRASARRRGRGVRRRRAAARPRGARARRPRAAAARGEGGAVADQRHAVHGRVRSLGLVRARRLAAAADLACAQSLEALQGSRTSFLPQIHALRPLRGQGDSAANILRLLDGSAIIEAHRWCDKVQDAYSLRCAPQVHGASRDLLDYVDYTVSVELERGDRQPARARRRRHARLERELPRPAARVRARCAGDGGVGAGEHLRAAGRAARQSESLRRSAGVPHHRRRAEQRLHDPAVRRCVTRIGEQGALPSGVGRLDSDECRAGGSRVDGQRRRTEGVAGARELRACARRSSCSRARRRSSSTRRSSPAAGVRATRAAVRELSPRLQDDRSLAPDIEAAAVAIRDGSLLAAVEAEVGELR